MYLNHSRCARVAVLAAVPCSALLLVHLLIYHLIASKLSEDKHSVLTRCL